MKVKLRKLFIIINLILVVTFLSSCNRKVNLNKPTKEFYINDTANALLNSTKWTIYAYSDELYKDSSSEEYEIAQISGSQVVVLTYIGSVGDINTTEIFNSWGIGKNDMGILLVLFFEEFSGTLVYKELIFEIGLKMSGYLSAFTANTLVEDNFNHETLPGEDYDLRLIALYFAILEYIYLNVYEYNSYNYESFFNENLNNQYEYFGRLPSEEFSLPLWLWIIIAIFFLLGSWKWLVPLLLFPFSRGRSVSGGGGKSIGYWFRK